MYTTKFFCFQMSYSMTNFEHEYKLDILKSDFIVLIDLISMLKLRKSHNCLIFFKSISEQYLIKQYLCK